MSSGEGGGPDAPSSSIVLVGMMGAGKTTVGRRLAEVLGWDLFDSDEQVETMVGCTVGDIWRRDGEEAFRRLESQVLADALASTTCRVIAAAGGTVLSSSNRRMLLNHRPVVWLRARPATLAVRAASGRHRPLLDTDPVATLANLDAVRRPYYQEVADLVVDVDDLTTDQVVACIEAALEHG